MNELSDRVAKFKAELEALCRRHGLQLAVSDYGALCVWNLIPDVEPLWSRGFEDYTNRPDNDLTAEQEARNMLERMGIENAQRMSSGQVVELANLIAAKRK